MTANADIPAGVGERRHDPLCPAPLCDYTGKLGADCMGYEDCHHLCQCDLIARVREDERDNCWGAIADHVAAVAEAEQRGARKVQEQRDDDLLTIRAAALADARERVLGLTVTEYTQHFQSAVLFHIDALRGEDE